MPKWVLLSLTTDQDTLHWFDSRHDLGQIREGGIWACDHLNKQIPYVTMRLHRGPVVLVVRPKLTWPDLVLWNSS